MSPEESWKALMELSRQGRVEVFIDDGSWQPEMLAEHIQWVLECDAEEDE